MKTIHKYHLATGAKTFGMPKHYSQTIQLPKGAEILTVQIQHHELILWALVDIHQPLEGRFIETAGTGVELPEIKLAKKRVYIATIQMDWFVGHIFEIR